MVEAFGDNYMRVAGLCQVFHLYCNILVLGFLNDSKNFSVEVLKRCQGDCLEKLVWKL